MFDYPWLYRFDADIPEEAPLDSYTFKGGDTYDRQGIDHVYIAE